MGKLLHFTPKVTAQAVITLNEDEVRALEALVGYGVDPLIKHFYQHMGQHYLKPYEAGLRSFLKTACQAAQGVRAVDDAQRDLEQYRIKEGRRQATAATTIEEQPASEIPRPVSRLHLLWRRISRRHARPDDRTV